MFLTIIKVGMVAAIYLIAEKAYKNIHTIFGEKAMNAQKVLH